MFINRIIFSRFMKKKEVSDYIVEVVEIIPGVETTSLDEIRNDGRRFRNGDVTEVGKALPEASFGYKAHLFEKETIKGQVVVDLGAGRTPDAYTLAGGMGATGYIGVEPHFGRELLEAMEADVADGLSYLRGEEMDNFYTKGSVTNDDMLSFLRRLPDHSVSIFASGIDNFVLDDSDYVRETVTEIVRVLHPTGVYICDFNSVIVIPDDMDGLTLHSGGNLHVYRVAE